MIGTAGARSRTPAIATTPLPSDARFDFLDQLGHDRARLARIAGALDRVEVDGRVPHGNQANHAEAEVRGALVGIEPRYVDRDRGLLAELAVPLLGAVGHDQRGAVVPLVDRHK